MTWTRINPEDPGTFPEPHVRKLVTIGDEARVIMRHNPQGHEWVDDAGVPTTERLVTLWQDLPPLPGEEAEATIDCWECAPLRRQGCDAPACGKCGGTTRIPAPKTTASPAEASPVARDVAASHSAGAGRPIEPPAELVERVAKAIYDNGNRAFFADLLTWEELTEDARATWRLFARAALSALPRPAADPAQAWHERPNAPGWWMRKRQYRRTVEWLSATLINGQLYCLYTPAEGDGWYGPVVVPEQPQPEGETK